MRGFGLVWLALSRVGQRFEPDVRARRETDHLRSGWDVDAAVVKNGTRKPAAGPPRPRSFSSLRIPHPSIAQNGLALESVPMQMSRDPTWPGQRKERRSG